MERLVSEFVIKDKSIVKERSGDIYRRLGLLVSYSRDTIHIKSTESTHIKSVGSVIHVHTHSPDVLYRVANEGLVKEDQQYSMPIELADEFGNKILVSFIPTNLIKHIAIVTSGGDAPGMNLAIRSALRIGIKWGAEMYGVYCGFEGLIEGNIQKFNWDSVNNVIDDGGTFLMSSRSERFRSREGRKEAAYNLSVRKIEGLVVIGGDGSIRGATILLSEFPGYVEELVAEGRLPEDSRRTLQMVAIPASIDNDIPHADMTLGASSALHRIIESVDHIISTMVSHRRVFVIEVMGRDCGWIALMSSFATGADYVFLPEVPCKDWKQEILEEVRRSRAMGKKGIFVIVSEGAVNDENEHISSAEIVDHLTRNVEAEVKLLRLGHLQRGGPPSASDKISGTILGIKAMERLLYTSEEKPSLVCMSNGEYCFINLDEVFDVGNQVARHREMRDFKSILELRGASFKRAFLLNDQLIKQRNKSTSAKKIGILHGGKRAGGMNSALHAVVRYCLSMGQDIYVIQDGFEGLLDDKIVKASEYDYVASISSGGSAIGIGIPRREDTRRIYKKIREHGLDALIVVGGTEALFAIAGLKKLFAKHSVAVKIILVPATASNNLPCTEVCVGSDTALNCITRVSEVLRLSSTSIKDTVFVLEVHGGNCGYLAVMGGIASGAFASFIPERKYLIGHLSETARRLKQRFVGSPRPGLLLIRNEKTFYSVSTDAFSKLLETDGDGRFNTRYCVLGHIQEGANPSPLDRINATLLGIKAIDIILEMDSEGIVPHSGASLFGLIGIKGRSITFTDVDTCLEDFDADRKREKSPWWLTYANICTSIE